MKWFGSEPGIEARPPSVIHEPVTVPPAETRDTESLDTLAAVFRLLGQYSLHVGAEEAAEVRRQCDGWARHILLCEPAPGLPADSATPGRRYWSEARRFATRLRTDELERVGASMGELRRTVWAVVDGLTELLTEGSEVDNQVIRALDLLKDSLHERSPETLRASVEAAIQDLTSTVHQRKRHQEAQLRTLGERMADLTEDLHEVRRENATDALTHLFNRHPFDDSLLRATQLRRGFQQPACLLLVDVDQLQQMNDRHGHLAGDAVLRALADCIARTFPRRSDLAARLGDDGFGVILPGTRLREGTKLAERLLVAVRELAITVETQTEPIHPRISIGLSEVGECEEADEWLQRTDEALREAKQTGRDRFWCAELPRPGGRQGAATAGGSRPYCDAPASR